MESLYWVISRDCNQRCAHCYNDSQPGAPGLSPAEVSACIAHLPDPADVPIYRIILSGGEVLTWPELLFQTLAELHARYQDQTQLMVQTNGDLLDGPMLQRLLDHQVCRIDVSGMDSYHPKSTLRRQPYLTQLFEAHGMIGAHTLADTTGDDFADGVPPLFAFWGATEDRWIGPLWPRGARQRGLSTAGPQDRFCSMWSGAKNFLNYRDVGSEVNVQLADVYPCCPMTCRPLGCLLKEPLIAMLDRCAQHPVFQALNQGRPEAMGESVGISEAEGVRRSAELGNHCLWCDEFFTKHAPELLHHGSQTERGARDLELGIKLRHTA